MLIGIVISRFIKRYSKPKLRAPAYSRVLHRLEGFIQWVVQRRSRSSLPEVQRWQGSYLFYLFSHLLSPAYKLTSSPRQVSFRGGWEDGGLDDLGCEFLKR